MKKNRSWIRSLLITFLLLAPTGSVFAFDNVEQSSPPLMNGSGGYDVKLQYYDTYDGTLKFALGTEKNDTCTFNSRYVSREFATPKTDGKKPYELTYTWKDLPDGTYCTGWLESNERTTKLGVNTFKDFDYSQYENIRKIVVTSTKVNKEKFKPALAVVKSEFNPPSVEVTIEITNPNVDAKYQMVLGDDTNSNGACLQNNAWKGSEHNPYNGTTTVEGGAIDSFLNEDRSLYVIKDWWGKGLHNNLPSGTYCIGLNRQRIEGAWLTEPAMWNLGSFVIPEYYTEIVDKGTKAAPNANGCLSEGTDSYCMLAPIPIPDVNGNIDPTGRINVKEGVGIYIESIIKLVIGIIGVLAVLMIVIGGIEYMSTVSLGEKEGAKSRIMNALFGLLLALGSYILLNTINPALTDVSVSITGVELGGEAPITDNDGGIPTTVPTPTNITIVTGSAQKLAEDILKLKNSKITFQADQHGDTRSSPEQNIIDTSKNLLAWTSKRSDVGAKQIALDAQMLSGLIAVSDASSTPISVSVIAGGDHSADSRHYSGIAFDVSARATDLPRVKAMGQACKLAGATELLGPCDSYPKDANGKDITGLCKATGFNTRADHWNHVHCGWPR